MTLISPIESSRLRDTINIHNQTDELWIPIFDDPASILCQGGNFIQDCNFQSVFLVLFFSASNLLLLLFWMYFVCRAKLFDMIWANRCMCWIHLNDAAINEGVDQARKNRRRHLYDLSARDTRRWMHTIDPPLLHLSFYTKESYQCFFVCLFVVVWQDCADPRTKTSATLLNFR